MCADDVVCTGAEPLAFLDYVAVGRLDPVGVAELVGGVAAGCREAGCALVGGETAEHPGLMEADAFDLAGCCIGVVERVARDRRLGGARRRRRSSAWPRPGCTPTATRWSGRWSPSGTSTSPSRTRRGCAGRSATPRPTPSCGRAPHEIDGDARRGAADPDPDLRAGRARRPRGARRRRRTTSTASPTSPAAGCPGNVPRALPAGLGARLDPTRWPMPSVMRLFGALGGLDDAELRATFNGGLGMVVVVPPGGRRRRHRPSLAGHGIAGDRRRRGRRGGRARRRALRRGRPRDRRVSGRIAVGVSGAGSNLRALHAAAVARRARRRDRARLRRPGLPGARLGGGAGDRDRARARRRRRDAGRRPSPAPRPDVVVLAGYMRIVGPAVLAAFAGPDPQHPPVAAAGVPGRPRGPRRARPRRRASPASTVHLVDATLDGGPIVAQEAVAGPARRRRGRACTTGSRRSSIGCCRARSRCSLAGAIAVAPRRPARPARPRARRRARSRCRAAPCCRSPTRPASSTSAAASSRAGSSSSRPAAPRGRSAMPACR